MKARNVSVITIVIFAIVSGCKAHDPSSATELASATDGITPSGTGQALDVDGVVKAMEEIRRIDGSVATRSTVEACTGNSTPHWSPIVSHFYCQLGMARACFTGYVRDSSKPNYQTNQGYRDAYNFCKNDAQFKWVADNPVVGPAFQYVMFSVYTPGLDTFTIESQDLALNKFYGVTGPGDCNKRFTSSTDSRRPASERCGNFTPGSSNPPVVTNPGSSGAPCSVKTNTSGWTYTIHRNGSLYNDPRWSSYGGASNGTHSSTGADDFLKVLIAEGTCAGSSTVAVPPAAGTIPCSVKTNTSGWTYTIHRNGSLYSDPRWSNYGGASNGTHSATEADKFLKVLIAEGTCAGSSTTAVPAPTGAPCVIKTNTSGWTYTIHRNGSLYSDPRWSNYGGASNGTHSQTRADDFLRDLIAEGTCL